MRSSAVCSSIEAEKIELQCRKFFPHLPRRDPKFPKLIYPFKASIFGIARVTEAYSADVVSYRDASLRDHCDEIHGEALDGFSLKALGKEKVQHATGSHKATFVQCRGGVYAHVEIGTRELLAADQTVIHS